MSGENIIHPSAVVDPRATLGEGVEIGPYAVIEGPVRLGDGARLGPHVHILGDTEIGAETRVHTGAVIGDWPQDLKYRPDQPSGVRIGRANVIREHVTIHRATTPETCTTIGDHNFLMAGSHVGHDCRLGDRNILANAVLLAGHVVLESRVIIAGGVPVHQFCRIGELAMLTGFSACGRDVPPYFVMYGRSRLGGVNLVGLRRAADVSREALEAVRAAYKTMFRSDLPLSAALDKLEAEDPTPEVQRIVTFCRATRRGIAGPLGEDDLDRFE